MSLTSKPAKAVPIVCHVRVPNGDDDGDFVDDDLDYHDPLPQTHIHLHLHMQ